MRLVAIVPTLEEAANVTEAVRRLREEADEVRVADGGSTDDTCLRAEAAGATVVRAPRGYAAQCEAATAGVEADAFWFVAADSRVGVGAGRAVREALAAPSVVYGGSWLSIDDAGLLFRFVEFGGNFRALRHRLALPDQGLFVRAAAYRAVGGMPDSPIPHALLCHRLAAEGEFRLVAPATVTSSRKWRTHGFWTVATAHGRTYRTFRRTR